MKILWVSNSAFVGTGYGQGTAAVVPRLQEDGHEVTILSIYGIQGAGLEIDGIRYVPTWKDQWGNDCFEAYAETLGCDLVIIHRDAWVNPKRHYRVPVLVWTPLDSEPLPPLMYETCQYARWIATMSHHSVEQFKRAGLDAHYVPHSIDPEVFHYGRDRSLRKMYAPNIPEDAFLVLINGANKGFPSRKAFPEMFEALSYFQKTHDDVYFHIHSMPTNDNGGPDLQTLGRVMSVDMSRGSFTAPVYYNSGVPPQTLAYMYQSADVLLSPSYGEGFGIPILEAQACGLPVITNDFGAMSEITWHGNMVGNVPWFNALYSYWHMPKVDDITNALESRYARRHDPKETARAANVADQITTSWTHNVAHEVYWRPLLKRIERDLAVERGDPVPL